MGAVAGVVTALLAVGPRSALRMAKRIRRVLQQVSLRLALLEMPTNTQPLAKQRSLASMRTQANCWERGLQAITNSRRAAQWWPLAKQQPSVILQLQPCCLQKSRLEAMSRPRKVSRLGEMNRQRMWCKTMGMCGLKRV